MWKQRQRLEWCIYKGGTLASTGSQEKGMEQISKSPQVQRESGPADTLTSDFYLQHYKRINVCCLSPLRCGVLLWQPQGTHTPLRWELGYKPPHSWVPKVMNWTRKSPCEGFRLPREISAPFPSSLSLLPPAKAKARYCELQWTTLEKFIRMIQITVNSNTQCQWRWRVMCHLLSQSR